MLEDFIITIGLITVYSGFVALNMWILSKIPFVRKSARRFMDFIDRVNDKLDEACGCYETWR